MKSDVLLLLHQARQDILAQDLAEAIDSQVELAEQLRCYREENEELLRDKQGVCVCVPPPLSTIMSKNTGLCVHHHHSP